MTVIDRAAFERLVASTTRRAVTGAEIRAQLARQTSYQREPDDVGLDELAGLLASWFAGGERLIDEAIGEVERAYARQPLVHFYGFALRREAGRDGAARDSLDALLELDPGDPMAVCFDAFLRSEPVAAASEEVRLQNIARLATTPLLKNPYSLSVGILFEALRGRERARVLDVGVGSGAQMAELLALVGRLPHKIRRLEIVGLDFMRQFLATAGERIAAAAEALGAEVVVAYEPIEGRIETLDASTCRAITGYGLDAANATIALHEIAGEAKLAALSNLHLIAPGQLVIAEWNYCLENVLAATSTEFVFNVRSVAAAMVAALRERYTLDESRAVVRDWLSQGAGQLTCSAEERQECFLDVTTWRALVEHCDFEPRLVDRRWLGYAAAPRHAAIAEEGWYLKTSDYGGATPIALLVASPSH